MTPHSYVGDAEKNVLDKAAHGFEQRVHVGADVRIDEKTGIAVDGSLSGRADTDTAKSTEGTRGLGHARLEALELARDAGAWHLSLGRFTEPIGVTGYYYNKEYDGARAVWTDAAERTQVRLGYGDFHRNTGISDSAYTHAARGMFLRAPTKWEWLGYAAGSDSSSHYLYVQGRNWDESRYKTAAEETGTYESLYRQLTNATTPEEERQIINSYLDVIKAVSPDAYRKIERRLQSPDNQRGSGIPDTYAWEKVTAEDVNSHATYTFYRRIQDRWSDHVFGSDTDRWSDWDTFDAAAMQQRAEQIWDGAVAGAIESHRADTTYRLDRESSSAFLPRGTYRLSYQFTGYGAYRGTHVMQQLDLESRFGDTLRTGDVDWTTDFEHFDRTEARRRATAGLWDKHYRQQRAMVFVQTGPLSGIGMYGTLPRRADVSLAAQRVLEIIANNWRPEDDSTLPLQETLFGKLRGIIPVVGTVLQRDRTPGLHRAAYVQVKRALSPAVGVSAFYLRSVRDRAHEMAFANGDHNDVYRYDRLANVVGLGAAWQVNSRIRVTADWGRNMTDFGRMMNGSTVYTHDPNTSKYTIDGRRTGSAPTFWVLRCDIGASDTDRPGSWNAFVDYKYFEHGSFFGGNGTEGVPDRYIDGIKSFTVGAGYVPMQNLLVEAFYTFGAKGIGKRDTLYGAENFKLGDYARVQVTYKF